MFPLQTDTMLHHAQMPILCNIYDVVFPVGMNNQVAKNAIKDDKQFLYRIIYLTVLFYVLTWVNVYTAYRAFGVEVDFIQICAIVPAIMLVAHVPVTLLGNLGYFESVFVFYFLLVGVGGAETLAMGLFLRLKTLTMGVVGFGVYLVYKQKNELDLKQAENKQNTLSN